MTADNEKLAFEAEFSPDLTHANVVQTFQTACIPSLVRHHLALRPVKKTLSQALAPLSGTL